MLSNLNNAQKGILYAILGYSAFVVSDSCAKWLTPHYPVFQIVGWTYFFALMAGLIFSSKLGGLRDTLKTNKLPIHIGRSIFNCGLALSIVLAFNHLPMISVYPVLFLSPFVITVCAIPIYKERVKPVNWLVILAGFSGVIIAFRPWTGEINPWIIVPFFTVLCITGLSLLARAVGKDQTVLSLSFYPNIINTVLIFPYALVTFSLPQLEHIPIFILGGLMLTCGITGVASAYLHTKVAIVAPLHYVQLALVFLVGYFVFNEVPDIWMICGSLIIVASGLALVFFKNK